MPSATNLFYYGDIPFVHHDAWKFIHKAEHQAMLAVQPEAGEEYMAKAIKLARKAVKSLPEDLRQLYAGNRLAKAIFERAEAKYSNPTMQNATPLPEVVQEQPKTVRLTIKIPPAHKRNLTRTPSPDSGNTSSSSSSSGPERSEPAYRTQRSSPYKKPAPRARAPRDRAPYRNFNSVDASVDALASVLQSASIFQEFRAPTERRTVRTVPAGYDMDDLAAALAASTFGETHSLAAQAGQTSPPSSPPKVALAQPPAPEPSSPSVPPSPPSPLSQSPALPSPSPSSPSSSLDSAAAANAHAMDWAAARRLKARRAILPVDSVPSRRREGRFNPLDRSARGTERTKERS